MRNALRPLVGALALCAFILGTSASSIALAQGASQPPKSQPSVRLEGVVNVNQASAEQLQLLPGVGPARAKAIIDYRKDNGAFERLDDLLAVSGIGPKALERLRPYVVLEGKTTAGKPSM